MEFKHKERINRNRDTQVERLLDRQSYVIDFLPEQAPPDGGGNYWDVEQYFLQKDPVFFDRMARVLLKLFCYCNLELWMEDQWVTNPSPEYIAKEVQKLGRSNKGTMGFLLSEEDLYILLNGDELAAGVYGDCDNLFSLLSSITLAEGLHFYMTEEARRDYEWVTTSDGTWLWQKKENESAWNNSEAE